MLDINDRATLLTEKNAKINNVIVDIVNNDGFKDINQKFDLIITNPPVRTGKKNIYQMFHDSYDALNEEGMLIFVLNKKQGAMSAIDFCTEIYKKVTVINKKSGFLIVQCIK
jgi:16S rRNA (guanine1207-N2)-methyltransferase